METIQTIFDWSEAWSPLIPLTIYLTLKSKNRWTKPIFYYLLLATLFGTAIDIIWKRNTLGFDSWFQHNLWWWYDKDPESGKLVFKNLIFYNLLSLARLLFFTWFFSFFLTFFKKIIRYITWVFMIQILINFLFLENIKDFSSSQLTIESGILLFYCLKYFYNTNLDDMVVSPMSLPQYWIVIGLTLYTSVNFLIFLFYKYLMTSYKIYAVEIWNVHNVSYILLSIFIAISFYQSKRNE